jgi:Transposase zinc-binding domain
MARPALEVADVFRDHGAAWRHANRGHVSLLQLKVMSAIESCRTAALGGHVARCEDCAHTTIAYNSCRNRHCPKCQGAAARAWMAAREAELLPIPYFHVVFTLPSAIGDIAYQNKAVIYDLLFKASSETMLRIAADPKYLGARVGITSVLHTWGSAMTHHPPDSIPAHQQGPAMRRCRHRARSPHATATHARRRPCRQVHSHWLAHAARQAPVRWCPEPRRSRDRQHASPCARPHGSPSRQRLPLHCAESA